MVDEGVPGLVAVCEGWLGGEVVADFDGLGSAVAQVVDLASDVLVLVFELLVSVFELVVAAVVVVGVMGGGCCGGDELVHQRDGFFDPLPQLSLLGFELAGVVDRFIEQTHGVIERVVVGDALGQGCDERVLDLVLGDVGRGAAVGLVVFVVAAPDVAAVFAGGVPNFPPKPASTIGAFDLVGKGMGAGGAFACAAGKFCLHGVPRGGVDDGLVVAGDIVLGYFTFVDFHGFGQEVGSETLLQERVAFVFLVGQDRTHSGRRPHSFAARGGDLISGEFCCDGLRCCSLKEAGVDAPHDRSLSFVDGKVSVFAFLVSKQ